MCASAVRFLLNVAILLSAASASAAPPRGARLTWARGVAAEGCVGSIGLEEDVKARLGYDPFVLPSALSVEGAVVRESRGFRAELVTRDAAGRALGTRQLVSREADCRSLGEAVAVAITVAIDPEASGIPSPRIEEVPPTTAAPATPAPSADVHVSPLPRGHATASFGATAGLLPGIGGVASLRAMKNLGAHGQLGLGAHFWPEQRDGRLGFALATAALEACAVPWPSARWLRWCGALHVGLFQVFVHAPELTPVEVGMFPWAGVDTGPALSLPLAGSLRLDGGVALVVPLVRRQALLRGQTEPVWEQNAVGGRAELGLRAEF